MGEVIQSTRWIKNMPVISNSWANNKINMQILLTVDRPLQSNHPTDAHSTNWPWFASCLWTYFDLMKSLSWTRICGSWFHEFLKNKEGLGPLLSVFWEIHRLPLILNCEQNAYNQGVMDNGYSSSPFLFFWEWLWIINSYIICTK